MSICGLVYHRRRFSDRNQSQPKAAFARPPRISKKEMRAVFRSDGPAFAAHFLATLGHWPGTGTSRTDRRKPISAFVAYRSHLRPASRCFTYKRPSDFEGDPRLPLQFHHHQPTTDTYHPLSSLSTWIVTTSPNVSSIFLLPSFQTSIFQSSTSTLSIRQTLIFSVHLRQSP